MKNTYRILAFLVLICFYSATAIGQSKKTGQVYFIRSLPTEGVIANLSVYINDSLVCKLYNDRYSLHTLPVGKYKVSVQESVLSLTKKSEPLTITVAEGKNVFVEVVKGSGHYLKEVNSSAAKLLARKIAPAVKCL